MRDLYRGDGGRLSSYDEGWNDGVEAAEKAIRAENDARRGVEAYRELNATKFILEEYKQAHSQAAKWQQHYLERAEQAEADEQGLLADIERLGAECDAALAELAAIKEERLALAKECVEAWESAVEWSGYASDYFREKHGVYKDQYRLDNARDRLVMLPQAAIKAAQEGK